ncbi:hypothetical protein ACFQ2B_06825 [Streptomyces stramineus]
MARTARDVLADAARALAPEGGANHLVPALAAGEAPREVISAFALEQHHVITADRRSFLHLAGRAAPLRGCRRVLLLLSSPAARTRRWSGSARWRPPAAWTRRRWPRTSRGPRARRIPRTRPISRSVPSPPTRWWP